MSVLEATSDYIIIEPIEEGETTYGNIIVPDLGKEKPIIGKISSIGPGRESEFGSWLTVDSDMFFVGQTVLIPKAGTIRIDFNGMEYYAVRSKEIIAIIKDNINEE